MHGPKTKYATLQLSSCTKINTIHVKLRIVFQSEFQLANQKSFRFYKCVIMKTIGLI